MEDAHNRQVFVNARILSRGRIVENAGVEHSQRTATRSAAGTPLVLRWAVVSVRILKMDSIPHQGTASVTAHHLDAIACTALTAPLTSIVKVLASGTSHATEMDVVLATAYAIATPNSPGHRAMCARTTRTVMIVTTCANGTQPAMDTDVATETQNVFVRRKAQEMVVKNVHRADLEPIVTLPVHTFLAQATACVTAMGTVLASRDLVVINASIVEQISMAKCVN